MSDDPYTRHYWRFADEYPAIYDDDATYALWCRLMRLGDMAWPSAAHLPYGVKRGALARLTDAGLIFLEAGGRFRVRGMDKHRQARSESAKYAVNKRWEYARSTDRNTERSTDRNTETIPSRAEPSLAKPSLSGVRGPDAFDTYQQVTGSWPSPKVTPWLSQLVDDYDEAEVCDALIRITGQDPTRATLMSRVRDYLAAEAHRRSREADESRQREEAEYQRRFKEEMESMPEEQRKANMTRLREAMTQSGLLP